MNTDTNLTNRLRDLPLDATVSVTIDGQPGPSYTVEAMVKQHDDALTAARREGAILVLQKMEDILYQVAADGKMEGKMSQDLLQGVYEGIKANIDVARSAIDKDQVDFTVAPE